MGIRFISGPHGDGRCLCLCWKSFQGRAVVCFASHSGDEALNSEGMIIGIVHSLCRDNDLRL